MQIRVASDPQLQRHPTLYIEAAGFRRQQRCFRQDPEGTETLNKVRVAFLNNYFAAENGRCEKLPNPRYGRDEYRLPTWLTKEYVYNAYVSDLTWNKRKRRSYRCKGEVNLIENTQD